MASSLPNQSTTAAPSAATMAMGNYQAQASPTRSTNATNHAMLMQMARQHLQAQQVTLPNSNIPQVWEQRQVFDPITRLTSTCWQNTSTSDISRNPIIANATSTRYSGIVSVLPSSHNHFVGGLPDGYVLAIIQDPRRDHRQQQPRAHPSPIATHLTEQNTLPAAAAPATTNRNQLAATLLQQQQQTLAMPNPGTTATTYAVNNIQLPTTMVTPAVTNGQRSIASSPSGSPLTEHEPERARLTFTGAAIDLTGGSSSPSEGDNNSNSDDVSEASSTSYDWEDPCWDHYFGLDHRSADDPYANRGRTEETWKILAFYGFKKADAGKGERKDQILRGQNAPSLL